MCFKTQTEKRKETDRLYEGQGSCGLKFKRKKTG